MIDAIKLLAHLTRGYFNVWDLAGPALSSHRQKLMFLLTGQKLPKAKCGVTALETEFFRQVLPDSVGSHAGRVDVFADRCNELLADLPVSA